jgi:hypothetical protein
MEVGGGYVVSLNLNVTCISVSLFAVSFDICKMYYMQIFVLDCAARVASKREREREIENLEYC